MQHPSHFLKFALVLMTLTVGSRAIALQQSQQSQSPPALLAQAAPAFPMPSSVPANTVLKLDGSNTMTVINEALKQQFEQKFSGAKVELAAGGTDNALQALLDKKLDIVAIGRSLTPEEQAKGLVETPISREKIAILVGKENPFRGDISFSQFAKIFRGEITDWSEVGGAPGPIRLVDRPAANDTRLSLSKYKVFRDATFSTGANATQVASDDIAAMTQELGKDGISYAIASQALNLPDVHIVSMHKTLPNDPRYPYSQPRGYVYPKDASPAAQAFLGYATSPDGQAAVTAAKQTEMSAGAVSAGAVAAGSGAAGAAGAAGAGGAASTASPAATGSPTDATAGTGTASGTDPSSTTALLPSEGVGADAGAKTDLGWLWWLLLPLIPLLLWWLFKRGRRPVEEEITGSIPPAIPSRNVGTRELETRELETRELETREIGTREREITSRDGSGRDLGNRDLGIRNPNISMPNIPTANIPTANIPTPNIPTPNLGAAAGAVGAAAGAAALGAAALADRWKRNRLTLTPSDRELNVNWEVPQDHETAIREQGGHKKQFRLYDVTDVDLERQPPNSVKQYDCDTSPLKVPLDAGDRDYIGEIGYTTADNRWLKLARSSRLRVPTLPPLEGAGGAIAAGAAGLAAGAAGLAASRSTPAEPPAPPSTIQIVPLKTQEAYVSWEVPEAHRAMLREQGGRKLQLRLHDATDIDLDKQPAHRTQQYECAETDKNKRLPVAVGDRDYVAEIGYVTDDNRWFRLARSVSSRIPLAEMPGTGAAGTGAAATGAAAAAAAATAAANINAASNLASHAASNAASPSTSPQTRIQTPPTPCAISALRVNSKANCFVLSHEQMQQLQNEVAVSKALEPGSYLIRIKSGGFGYGADAMGEPMVMLWIYGGRVINRKTKIPVEATWVTLNGYADALNLQVLEPATLCAFFIDTHVDDNEGEVTLSAIKL